MKKYIFGSFFALASAVMFTSCAVEEGSDPGNDSKTNVLIYQYAASTPNDADVDTQLRITTNSATETAYMLTEKTEDYENRVASLTETGYQDYVVENGKQLTDVKGAAVKDTVVVNLTGDYTITVVSVGKGGKCSKSVNFVGTTWSDVATGTYSFADFGQLFGLDEYSQPATLQVKDSDPTQYRFKDFWDTGVHMTFTLNGREGTLPNGMAYKALSVPAQATPYAYGSYGTVYYADAWTHQVAAYNSYIREDNVVKIAMSWYVSDFDLLDISGYDTFTPNN